MINHQSVHRINRIFIVENGAANFGERNCAVYAEGLEGSGGDGKEALNLVGFEPFCLGFGVPLKFWSSDLNSESNCFLKSLRMFSSRMRSEGSRCSFAIVFFWW